MLDRILIFRPVINWISDGRFFASLIAWSLRILAVIVFIGSLGSCYKIWSQLPTEVPFKYIAAFVVMTIFVLAIGFFVINILLIRAEDILALPAVKDYSITPIFVICVKMIGEILATVYASLGVALGLAAFIGGDSVGRTLSVLSLPGMSAGSGSGFLLIVGGLLIGLMLLFVAYYVAEQIGALVDIARNTRKGR
ncbi:MAG: hypothetical protein KDK23_01855 [Leptospiraceae bacterium]|nr:hypothetical protein [Leptospiraceae bacterium]